MGELPFDQLRTTFHLPTGGRREFAVEGHVFLPVGTEFRWDDGQTYTVERSVFVLEKYSEFGDVGLHVYVS